METVKRSVVARDLGRGMNRHSMWVLVAKKMLCMTLQWWIHVSTFMQTHRMYNSKSEP